MTAYLLAAAVALNRDELSPTHRCLAVGDRINPKLD